MQTQYTLMIGGKTKRSRFAPREVTIDFTKLPEESQTFVIRYGLTQYLADGAAGAESQDAFNEGIAARQTKLANADFRRASGEPKADTETTRALRLARAAVRSAAKAKGIALDKEKVAELAEKAVESNPEYRAEAKRQLAAEAKAAEKAAGDDTMDALLAEIGIN